MERVCGLLVTVAPTTAFRERPATWARIIHVQNGDRYDGLFRMVDGMERKLNTRLAIHMKGNENGRRHGRGTYTRGTGW